MTDTEVAALVPRVVAGDGAAARVLAERLIPLIQHTVGRCLLRCRALSKGDARQITRDLVQQVFVALFENERRVLRQWDPARGRTFPSFISLVAEREVWSVLRSSVRSPFTEEPSEPRGIEDARRLPSDGATHGAPSPEEAVIGSQLVASLVSAVRERQGERGVLLLQLVVIEERSAEDVSLVTGMSVDAVYAWHTRLRRMLRHLQPTPASGPAVPPRRVGEEQS